MWKASLQSTYSSFEEFKAYSETFGLHKRLGYKTPLAAWKDNPVVQGSVEPKDYKKEER